MPFPTDGRNHHSGIKTEKFIVEYQNNNPNNSINNRIKKDCNTSELNWVHKGGTQFKEDCIISFDDKSIGVSIKNHKTGTFDWINSTKSIPQELKDDVNNFKDKYEGQDVTRPIRNKFSTLIDDYLENMDKKVIKEVLINTYDKYPTYILIRKCSDNQIILFDKKNLKKKFSCDNRFILKKKRAKLSRQIWLVLEDGTEINTNLRFRITLNNGLGMLLDRNKISVPSIKIQQDKVDKFIDECDDKVIVTY